ncbi:MAG: hypothetical protein AAB253_07425, partial [candidate division NC10 bacterium]
MTAAAIVLAALLATAGTAAAADQTAPPSAPVPPSTTSPAPDPRTQEALQRYNAGVGALQRRDLEYALY